jgi:DNA-binding CsgD family transcriptional regulator
VLGGLRAERRPSVATATTRPLRRRLAAISAELAGHVRLGTSPPPSRLEDISTELTELGSELCRFQPVDDGAATAAAPELVEALAAVARERAGTPAHVTFGAELTGREREVLELVAQGLSGSEIGRALFIADDTVKTHVKHVMTKLGARSRAHAVAIAVVKDRRPT